MDGYEVVRLVRETRPDARIICISGAGEKPVPAGVVFLGKPFRPETLRDLVKQACG
jgi:FixJ family two-component response regulator